MRSYGQYCGVARAADVIAERWALLIVRDLLVEPLRFGQLRDGLGAPSNILTTRLKELEASGIVERAVAPAPARGVFYRLTDYGRDLEPIVDAIGLWGARRMDAPREGEQVSDWSLASALRVGWTGACTRRTVWRVEAGSASAWAVTDPDAPLSLGAGEPPEEPDVTLGGPGLRRLLAGRRPAEVEASDPALLPEFARCFCVPLDA